MFYYPKSFFKLILVGIGLILVPLAFAFYNIAVNLERLAGQSQRAVFEAVQVTQDSRLLNQRITDMERIARQYLVVEDRKLLDGYTKLHDEMQETAQQLNARELDATQRSKLKELIALENQLYERIRSSPISKAGAEQIAAQFSPLQALGESFLAQGDSIIWREVEALRTASARAREILLWQLLAPIPLALLFAIVFTIVITRPFNQINTSIRRMGDGQLHIPIVVDGPQDLVDLGQRLDWLRLRLIELQEQNSKFFQHVSHEFKTPLAALREGSQILADEVVGQLTTGQREITNIIQHKTLQLQKLIYDLLNYSAAGAAETHKASLHLQPVNLRHAIMAVAEEQKLALKAKGLRFNLIGPDQVSVTADSEKLRIVIDNLLSNAIKFSPENGAIIMSMRHTQDTAQIDVSDQGPGISELDRDRVFEAFYQGQTPQTGQIEGTGLGLAIIKEYVLAHSGRVEIVNAGKPGAHFRVSLPLKQRVTT
jgi:two-component system, NtrC family, sensor histidine kinase GlrK